ncbi:MAG TPA: helix-turn-helix domain-containing protein, partial [Chryseosolibacter sp.]
FRFSAMRSKGLDRRLEDVERDYILDVYAANDKNLSRTAEKLGIDRKTLRERIRKYDLKFKI